MRRCNLVRTRTIQARRRDSATPCRRARAVVDAVHALAATDAGPRASAGRDGGEKEIGTVLRRRGKGQRSARTQNAMASAQRAEELSCCGSSTGDLTRSVRQEGTSRPAIARRGGRGAVDPDATSSLSVLFPHCYGSSGEDAVRSGGQIGNGGHRHFSLSKRSSPETGGEVRKMGAEGICSDYYLIYDNYGN